MIDFLTFQLRRQFACEMPRERSRKLPGSFREASGKLPGALRERSGEHGIPLSASGALQRARGERSERPGAYMGAPRAVLVWMRRPGGTARRHAPARRHGPGSRRRGTAAAVRPLRERSRSSPGALPERSDSGALPERFGGGLGALRTRSVGPGWRPMEVRSTLRRPRPNLSRAGGAPSCRTPTLHKVFTYFRDHLYGCLIDFLTCI